MLGRQLRTLLFLLIFAMACVAPQRLAGDLALRDLTGHAQHPSLARGHPLLLHFGATW